MRKFSEFGWSEARTVDIVQDTLRIWNIYIYIYLDPEGMLNLNKGMLNGSVQ